MRSDRLRGPSPCRCARPGWTRRALPIARALGAILVAMGIAVSPGEVSAQLTGPMGVQTERDRTFEIGVKVGLDNSTQRFILGGQARVPVDPGQRVELMAGYDFTFLQRFTERQLTADVAVFPEPTRSLYVGGGAAFRNTRWPTEDQGLSDRETRTGFSLFGGVKGGRAFSLFITQFEVRWSKVDQFDPLQFTLGLNFPIPLGF